MFSWEITGLGLALAVDAGVVSFAMGLLALERHIREKVLHGFLLSLVFGFFQALMVWLGSLGGYFFTFSSYGHYSQLMVGLIFLALALKFLQEGSKQNQRNHQQGILPLLFLAVATSIDALAAGVSLATSPKVELAAIEIGFVTFVTCAVFYSLSQFFKRIPEKWLFYIGGAIFLVLAIRIFIPYLPKGLL